VNDFRISFESFGNQFLRAAGTAETGLSEERISMDEIANLDPGVLESGN
jgi:hypothetical protein